MRRISAGLLMFRRSDSRVDVFLVHPGGPFWQNKDMGAWSIPKGEYTEGEDALDAAKREFEEETSIKPEGEFVSLDEIKQPSGKIISAWAFEGNCSPEKIRSNVFSMEWPPKSGQMKEFPEVDRGAWFSLDVARDQIQKGQIGFLERLGSRINYIPRPEPKTHPHLETRDTAGAQASLFE